MQGYHHPLATNHQTQYGTVGQALHIARKLLPFIPDNAGMLIVPCCRGGSAFTAGSEGTYSERHGASHDAVSYTHLVEAFRRDLKQFHSQLNNITAAPWFCGDTTWSVSYTHLDVYKRQGGHPCP